MSEAEAISVRFGIWVYEEKDPDLREARRAVSFLREKGNECIAFQGQHSDRIEGITVRDRMSFFQGLDVLIVLGGDGSMLAAAREGASYHVPMLGINLGHYGFMTECRPEAMEKALTALMERRYAVDRRMMLRAKILEEDGTCLWQVDALNDVVLCNVQPVQIIHASASIGDTVLESYACDSMIVASPTGSTAYSMTAGGPVVHPEMPCFVLTPVCALSLTTRPMILPATEQLTIRLTRTRMEGLAAADGQNRFPLKYGQILTVEQSPFKTDLIRIDDYNFYRVLGEKRKEWARNDCLERG